MFFGVVIMDTDQSLAGKIAWTGKRKKRKMNSDILGKEICRKVETK